MFSFVKDLAPFSVGVRATGEVTKEDFQNTLIPALAAVSEKYKGINLLMIFETPLKNFTAGAWLKDLEVNISYFLKWNKIAIVSNNDTLEKISGIFNIVAPGETKTFSFDELEQAKAWISLID